MMKRIAVSIELSIDAHGERRSPGRRPRSGGVGSRRSPGVRAVRQSWTRRLFVSVIDNPYYPLPVGADMGLHEA